MRSIPINKELQLSRSGYYETHLGIINGLLPVKVTPKEIEVLAAFMSFEGDIAKDRFGTTARKMVKSQLRLSDGGLGNYLRILKDKGYILSSPPSTELLINPLLIPNPKEQLYMFKLTNVDHVPDADN